ncbi:MAG: transporter substrate-binding domain-containing protein [Rhodobacteraceae bacterium]|nr:transporter substrate-binding domain-containing protein [Paracoccaceae bacterium]
MKSRFTSMCGAALICLSSAASAETLRIAMDSDPYPPFSFDSPDGEFTGFEVDLLKEYCERLKVECTIERVAWAGIIPALKSNKVDVIFNSMTITDARKKQISFTAPYYFTRAVLVASEGIQAEATAEGVKGLIIGVKAGTIHEAYAEANFADTATIRVYQSQDEVNQELLSGRIDAAIDDALPMGEFLSSDAASKLQLVGDLPKDEALGAGVGAGVRKDDTELRDRLNAVITAAFDDGSYDAIMKRYFAVDIRP